MGPLFAAGLASDGFMINLGAILLRFCGPLASDPTKMDKVDPTYCATTTVVSEVVVVRNPVLSLDPTPPMSGRSPVRGPHARPVQPDLHGDPGPGGGEEQVPHVQLRHGNILHDPGEYYQCSTVKTGKTKEAFLILFSSTAKSRSWIPASPREVYQT